jgi:hypothetical protein
MGVGEIVPGGHEQGVHDRADQPERDGPGGHVQDDPAAAARAPVPVAGHRDRDQDPGDHAQRVGADRQRP